MLLKVWNTENWFTDNMQVTNIQLVLEQGTSVQVHLQLKFVCFLVAKVLGVLGPHCWIFVL